MNKYIKPKSLTWWMSMVPLVLGLALALEPLHGNAALAQAVSNMTGGAAPFILINAGLAGIGVRGAIK